MDKAPCAFCGVESGYEDMLSVRGESFGTPCYTCPSCGHYVLGEDLSLHWKDSKCDEAFKIACLVREKQLASNRALYGVLGDDFQPSDQNVAKYLKRWWRISELLAEFPKTTKIIDRALLNLSRQVKHPMDCIEPKHEDLPFILFCPDPNLQSQWNYMKQMDFIQDAESTMKQRRLTITPTGWSRIKELSKIGRESRQAFVAMWFEPDMDKFYEDGIKPAVKDAGYECKRIDTVEHNNKICDEIVAEIRKSRFVIAEFTGQRGGVYFEAGFAMGLGLPVIWLVRKDEVEKLHFDTRQYAHIVYESAEELKQKLYNRIAATIY